MNSFFARTTSPLLVKLACNLVCMWPSFIADADTRLANKESEVINGSLLPLLGRRHPTVLVNRSLLYLALARDGLSRAELVDVLSLDDDVLNACLVDASETVHHRLPELAWAALEADLHALDVIVTVFDHGRWLLRPAAPEALHAALKAASHDQILPAHRMLADYFSGRWNASKKPYTGSDGVKHTADRGVAAQVCETGKGKKASRKRNRFN